MDRIFQPAGKTKRRLSVTGTAEISVKPDVTRITMDVSALDGDYSAALERLGRSVSEIKTAVSILHIDVNKLKTASFNVTSEYEGYNDGSGAWRQRFKGYRAQESLIIDLPVDNVLLGEALGALSALEAAPEVRIAFQVKDTAKAKERLMKAAVKDAAKKAKLLAEAAEVTLGSIVSINHSAGEGDFRSPTVYRREAALMAKAAADVTPMDVTVSDSVLIVWEIE